MEMAIHPNDHFVERRQGAEKSTLWIGLNCNGHILGPHFVQGNLDTREYLRIVQQDFQNLRISRFNV